MPFLALIAIYAIQVARRPLDVRLKKRHAGPLAVAALAVMLYLTWDWLKPGGISAVYFLGEFAGVTAVYLMTCSLVLATRLRWLEQWFGGLDRMYFWHRQYALWAMCGPAAMVEDLSIGLRRHGIPRDHLHAEHFAFR